VYACPPRSVLCVQLWLAFGLHQWMLVFVFFFWMFPSCSNFYLFVKFQIPSYSISITYVYTYVLWVLPFCRTPHPTNSLWKSSCYIWRTTIGPQRTAVGQAILQIWLMGYQLQTSTIQNWYQCTAISSWHWSSRNL